MIRRMRTGVVMGLQRALVGLERQRLRDLPAQANRLELAREHEQPQQGDEGEADEAERFRWAARYSRAARWRRPS
jgi:hypothetical protein